MFEIEKVADRRKLNLLWKGVYSIACDVTEEESQEVESTHIRQPPWYCTCRLHAYKAGDQLP